MKNNSKFIAVAASLLFLNVANAGNGVCTNNGEQLVCKKESFIYGGMGFNIDKDGKWCITTKFPDGQPDMIDCKYSSKNQCASDNTMRQYIQTRCVKNPKYSEDDE